MEDPVFFIYGEVTDPEKVRKALAELARLEKRTDSLLRAVEQFDRQHRFLDLSSYAATPLERVRRLIRIARQNICEVARSVNLLQKH